MDAEALLKLLQDGGLTVYPLSVASIISLAILFERLWRFRGIDSETRRLTRQTVEALVKRDVATARRLCEESKTPVAGIYLDAMRWKNIAVEDLERVLATSRQEAASDLKRGLWVVGTIGSLAPYVGLFGTVVGIIRAFQDMALVDSGVSEGLGGITKWRVSLPLEPETTYYWRVRAETSAGDGSTAARRWT